MDESHQVDKFKELARQLECDEDEAKFEGVVKKVASSQKAELPKEKPE